MTIEIDLPSSTLEVLNTFRTTNKITEACGRQWVMKCSGGPVTPLHLFSEYVISALARQFGLKWPKAAVATLKDGQGTMLAVVLEWIKGLEPIHRGFFGEVRQLMQPYLKNPGNVKQLCGFDIFSRWAFADDRKDDNLLVDSAGTFWFLDGEYYLGNRVEAPWNVDETTVERASEGSMFTFTSGLRNTYSREHFQPWLQRLTDGDLEARFDNACQEVPTAWKPTCKQIDSIRHRLFAEAPIFSKAYLGKTKSLD